MTQPILTEVTGRTPMLDRPRWLLKTPLLRALLRRAGPQPISGKFCHAFEIFQPEPHRIAKSTVANARPGAILILHDGSDSRRGNRDNTVTAVRLAVSQWAARGHRFVTIDELLAIPAYLPPDPLTELHTAGGMNEDCPGIVEVMSEPPITTGAQSSALSGLSGALPTVRSQSKATRPQSRRRPTSGLARVLVALAVVAVVGVYVDIAGPMMLSRFSIWPGHPVSGYSPDWRPPSHRWSHSPLSGVRP